MPMEMVFVMRKLYKSGYEDHPLDYYIVESDLDRGYYIEAGLFAGRSVIQATYVTYAVLSNLKNDW